MGQMQDRCRLRLARVDRPGHQLGQEQPHYRPSSTSRKSGNPLGSVVQQVYPAYQAKLAASNAVDFDDLLLHVATLLRENPEVRAGLDERYRYILVDEYQDTNLAQYAIARALSIDYPNLAVTGDPDQSIYGWRGANLNNILEFEKDFPAGPRRSPGAELPQHEADPARGRRTDLAQPAAEEEGPVHRERGGRAGPPGDLSHAQGRGRGHRRARSPARSPPAAAAPAISPSSIAPTP